MLDKKSFLNKIGKKGGHILVGMKTIKPSYIPKLKQLLPNVYNKSPMEK